MVADIYANAARIRAWNDRHHHVSMSYFLRSLVLLLTFTSATVIIVITCGFLSLYFWRQNKRADRGEILINELEGFRYTI